MHQKNKVKLLNMEYATFLKSIHLNGVQIRIASPSIIRQWAERKLPNGKIIGQVTSSQTVNYQKN